MKDTHRSVSFERLISFHVRRVVRDRIGQFGLPSHRESLPSRDDRERPPIDIGASPTGRGDS